MRRLMSSLTRVVPFLGRRHAAGDGSRAVLGAGANAEPLPGHNCFLD